MHKHYTEFILARVQFHSHRDHSAKIKFSGAIYIVYSKVTCNVNIVVYTYIYYSHDILLIKFLPIM